MTYRLDYQNQIKISPDRAVIYTISKKHRGQNPEKSHWTITMPKEVALFREALRSGYEDTYTAWNLYVVDGAACEVGRSVEDIELKIAKFVDSCRNEQWHGYPANYLKNNQDIPSAKVLRQWNNAGIISTATMKKIKGGQPCNL